MYAFLLDCDARLGYYIFHEARVLQGNNRSACDVVRAI